MLLLSRMIMCLIKVLWSQKLCASADLCYLYFVTFRSRGGFTDPTAPSSALIPNAAWPSCTLVLPSFPFSSIKKKQAPGPCGLSVLSLVDQRYVEVLHSFAALSRAVPGPP